jgi:hypothetical protein
MNSKVCTKCKVLKSVEEFHKKKSSKDGLTSWCRSCRNESNIEYRKENTEKGKEYSSKYRKENTEKEQKRHIKYYKENVEKIRETSIKYRKDHLEKIRERNSKYSKEHFGERKEYFSKYWKEHSEKLRENAGRRRALKKNTTVEKVDLEQLFENHKWICGICGLKIDKKLKWPNPLSISHDHILPLSKGGDHTYGNIQPAHLRCNLSKNNRISNMQLILQPTRGLVISK